MAERRPTLTASARDGVRNLRSGRKKACGAVEQKKGCQSKQASKQASKKLLALVAAIREQKAGADRTKGLDERCCRDGGLPTSASGGLLGLPATETVAVAACALLLFKVGWCQRAWS